MPIFVDELVLFHWRTFRGLTRLSFSEVAVLTAIIGPNGSGKSNLLDALAFVLATDGAKPLDLRGLGPNSYVAATLHNGPTIRRSSNDQFEFGGAVLQSFEEYREKVRSCLKSEYIPQLALSGSFFDPRDLARFIESQDFHTTDNPWPETAFYRFEDLVSDLTVLKINAQEAHRSFVNAKSDFAEAKKDSAMVASRLKANEKRATLKRQIALVRKLSLDRIVSKSEERRQISETGLAQLQRSLRASEAREHELEHKIASISSSTGDLSDGIAEDEVKVGECRNTLAKLSYELNSDLVREAELDFACNKEKAISAVYEAELKKLDAAPAEAGAYLTLDDVGRKCIEATIQVMAEQEASAISMIIQASERLDELTAANISSASRADISAAPTTDSVLPSAASPEEAGPVNEDSRSEREFQERNSSLEFRELLKIDGVLGLLRDLVSISFGMSPILQSIMGENANMLVVKSSNAVEDCSSFINTSRLSFISGVIDVSTSKFETEDDIPERSPVRDIYPSATLLSASILVNGSEFVKEITTIASCGAILVDDLFSVDAATRQQLIGYTICDRKGSIITPEGFLESAYDESLELKMLVAARDPVNSSSAAVSEVPQPPAVRYLGQPLDELDSAWRDDEASTNRWYRDGMIEFRGSLKANRERLEAKLEGWYGSRLTTGEPTDLSEQEGRRIPPGPSESYMAVEGHWLVAKFKRELSRSQALFNANNKQLTELTERIASRRAELEEVGETTSNLIERQRTAKEELKKYDDAIRQARADHSAEVELRATHERNLALAEIALNTELQNLDSERELAIQQQGFVNEMYVDVDYDLKAKELAYETRQLERVDPKKLIKKYNDLHTQLPAGLPPDHIEIQETEARCREFERDLGKAESAYRLASFQLQEAKEELEEMKAARRKHFEKNLKQLIKRVSGVYHSIAIGWSGPWVGAGRFRITPLDEDAPWQGVDTQCAPPGKALTPAVQLSTGEMAAAELSIRIGALINNGTKFIMLDEADSHLDGETCNTLANFFRRRTGPYGGMQVLMATHQRGVYNATPNLITVFNNGSASPPTSKLVVRARRPYVDRREEGPAPLREQPITQPRRPDGANAKDGDQDLP